MKEKLAEELADLYLDRDPTNVPDFEAATRRAKMVIDIDPENVKARRFLIRATHYSVDVRMKEGQRNYSQLYDEINGIRRHAEWLESKLGAFLPEQRNEVKDDLAGYYDQVAEVKDAEGNSGIGLANEASARVEQDYKRIPTSYDRRALLNSMRSNLQDQKRHIEKTSESFRESDRAFKKSLQFQPVNARAQRQMEHHQSQYSAVEKLLREIDDQLRQIKDIEWQIR